MTSLRSLQGDQANSVLSEIARSYWLPYIRAAAQRLLDGTPEPKSFMSPIDAYCDSEGNKRRASNPGTELASHPDLFGARKVGGTAAVEGGTLVAVDKGEFGGALEFRPASDLPQQLLNTQEPIQEESVSAVVK